MSFGSGTCSTHHGYGVSQYGYGVSRYGYGVRKFDPRVTCVQP
jgi:hypothetical protein